MRNIFFTFLLFIFLINQSYADIGSSKVAICDDGTTWPPYVYFSVENGRRTNKLEGATYDLVEKYLKI